MFLKFITVMINISTIIIIIKESQGFHETKDMIISGVLVIFFFLNILMIILHPYGYEYIKSYSRVKKLEQEMMIKNLEKTFK
jgi:hypothetical protein